MALFPGYHRHAIFMDIDRKLPTLDDFKELVSRIDSTIDGSREMIATNLTIDTRDGDTCRLEYECYLKAPSPPPKEVETIAICAPHGVQPGDILLLPTEEVAEVPPLHYTSYTAVYIPRYSTGEIQFFLPKEKQEEEVANDPKSAEAPPIPYPHYTHYTHYMQSVVSTPIGFLKEEKEQEK